VTLRAEHLAALAAALLCVCDLVLLRAMPCEHTARHAVITSAVRP
jgi:hypothetical protein